MSKFTAQNGRIITDKDLERWEHIYAQGRFPVGEKSIGEVVNGSPIPSVAKYPNGMRPNDRMRIGQIPE